MTTTRERSFGKDIPNRDVLLTATAIKQPLTRTPVQQEEANQVVLPVEQVKEPLVVKNKDEGSKLVLPIVEQPKPIVPGEIDKLDKRDALTKAIASNPCAKCRANKIGHCECVIILGGELEDEVAEQAKAAIEEKLEERQLEEEVEKENLTPEQVVVQGYAKLKPDDLNNRTLHPEMLLLMKDLLEKGLLQMTRNPLDGILDFTYQYNPNEEMGDQFKFHKLMEVILKQLVLFEIQKEHAMVVRNQDGRIVSLRINFPRPAHYDRFIQLFPAENSEQQDRRKVMSQLEVDNLSLNPLSTKLTLRAGNQRRADSQQEKDEEHHYYSPLRIRMNKLKPTGFR